MEVFFILPAMVLIYAGVDGFLDNEALNQLIKTDTSKLRPRSIETGYLSKPVEVVLGMLVIKRLFPYRYAETERYLSDSPALRQFYRLYLNRVLGDTTLIHLANLFRAETLEKIHPPMVELAKGNEEITGKKLCIDGTVVESNIYVPSDNWQLSDSVQVESRTISRHSIVTAQNNFMMWLVSG